MTASPLNHGALAAAVRSGTATLGTFVGMASPLAAEVCAAADGAAAARRLEQGWSFVAIGSDSTLLAAAVSAEFGRARTARPAEEIRNPR
jgi:2-keto-3-deoxy-L-rhamnonate aldolase RhmA